MTCENEDNALAALLPLLTNGDEDRFRDALRLLLNATRALERQQHLRAAPYERTDERRGHANGFKNKDFQTRLGALNLQIPQVRDGSFYPQSLEKGLRSERALKVALAEMYVQGVSTRKVAAITEQLCGFDVSSTQVSRAAAELDAVLLAWRERPLGETPYLILDARYEKVRRNGIVGIVQSAAVLVAVGVTRDGKRQILGVSVALSEHEAHWRQFLKGLVERGLSGVNLIVSDDHSGLKAARQAVFGSIPWQRCQFHLQQNAQAYVPKYVPKQELKARVAADIRGVFNAPDGASAEARLKAIVANYQKHAPKLSAWLEENLPDGLSVFALPDAHRRLLRTTNGLERVNKEVKRRTRVATLFPSEASCLRLVSAVLMEISDDWEAGKVYLTFTT